jgi:hypothetical protein
VYRNRPHGENIRFWQFFFLSLKARKKTKNMMNNNWKMEMLHA